MPKADAASTDPSPHQPRREKGFPEDQAKGYGIWLAKGVASRRFGQKSSSDGKQPGKKDAHEEEPKFRSEGAGC